MLIPVYNGERYLFECLSSILVSKFCGTFEVIVVNDGSTDGTAKILEEFSANYQNIKVINQVNAGIESALNAGIEKCCGKLILRMDADDVMLPDRIQLQYNCFLNNNDLDWISSPAIMMDWNSVPLVQTWSPPNNDIIFDIIDYYNFIIHPTVAIRRDVLLSVGGYRKGIEHKEDIDLWKRLNAAGYKYKFLDRSTIQYRLSNNSIRAGADFHAERKLLRHLIYYGAKKYVPKYLSVLPFKYWPRFILMLCLPKQYWYEKATSPRHNKRF